MPFDFGEALTGLVGGIMEQTIAEREAVRKQEDESILRQIEIIQHLADKPDASDELVGKAIEDLLALTESLGAKTGSKKRPAKGALKIGSELPMSDVLKMVRQVDEGERPIRGRTGSPAPPYTGLPNPPMAEAPIVAPGGAEAAPGQAMQPPPELPYTPHVRGTAGAAALPDVVSELPPPPVAGGLPPMPQEMPGLAAQGDLGSAAQAVAATLPPPPTPDEVGRGLGPLFRSREEMMEQEQRAEFMKAYGRAKGAKQAEYEALLDMIQDPRTPQTLKDDLSKTPQPKYGNIEQFVTPDGQVQTGYQVTTRGGPVVVGTNGEVLPQARPLTTSEQSIPADIRMAAAELGIQAQSIHDLSPEVATFLRNYVESKEFEKGMELNRAQAALQFYYYGQRREGDIAADRIKDTNRMLSAQELIIFGAPAGTTRGQAAEMGLVPRTTQQVASAAAARSVVPELERLERIIKGEEVDPRTGKVPGFGLLEPPPTGLAAGAAAGARYIPGIGGGAGQLIDRTAVWVRLSKQALMNDPLYADFSRTIDGMIVTLAKSFGDAANIAILEAERVRNLFPKLGSIGSLPDRQDAAERMMANLKHRVARAIEMAQDPQFNLSAAFQQASPRERRTVEGIINQATERYGRGVGVTNERLQRYRQRR
jgi:hypothetical protein